MTKKINTLNFGKIGDIHLKTVIPELEACYPGLAPTEYNLVIAPGEPAKTVGKLGLLLIAEETQDQLSMAVQSGRLVAMSPLAFNFAFWGEAVPPQVGDIVWFARHAGGVFEGADGREYRLIKDKDITGVLPPIDEEMLAKAKNFGKIEAQAELNLNQTVKAG